ncbi:MAG: hypothetical protein AN484_27110, partial [Aphanizomenon flos-aquae WA102]
MASGREGALWPDFVRERLDYCNALATQQMLEDAKKGRYPRGDEPEAKGRPEARRDSQPQKTGFPRARVNVTTKNHLGQATRRPGTKCPVEQCGCELYLKDCPTYKNGGPRSRLQVAQQVGVCLKCMGHPSRWECKFKGPFCELLKRCLDSPHHPLLHEGLTGGNKGMVVMAQQPSGLGLTGQSAEVHFAKVQRVGDKGSCLLMYDSGTQLSLVSLAYAMRAGLRRVDKSRLEVDVLGGQTESYGRYLLVLEDCAGVKHEILVRAVAQIGKAY